MEYKFTQSTRKHRIGRARALHVIENHEPLRTIGVNGSRDHLTWIAPDNRGLVLEIEAIDFGQELLVIHVMPHNFRRGK